MRIITISREFSSGGRELGKRLADELGFDYYDSEIITAIAKNSGLNKNYIEETLDGHGWKNFPISYRSTIGSSTYLDSNKVHLLLEQKKVIEEIGKLGNDCVIVGRNADIILGEYNPLNIFVCANMNAKIKRFMRYTQDGEQLCEKELIRKIKLIDKNRIKTREILTNSPWGQPEAYHLTVNTSDWTIKELAPSIANFANLFFGREK